MGKGSLLELLTKAVTSNTPAAIYQLVVPRMRALALILLATCPFAHAATYRVHAGQDRSMIQRVINRASSGDTVAFEAGTYPVTASFNLKCGITYTGPVATPATAEITTATANISLFYISGGCSLGTTTTIEYFHLNGAGALTTDGNSYANINILHNQMTSIPSQETCGAGCESVFFNFNTGITLANITIEYNSFGDANSCVAGANVNEGNCAGVIVNTVNPGSVINFVVQYNTFYHLQEGIHFPPVPFNAGAPGATCNHCVIQYNFFSQIHRIQVEFQIGLNNHPFLERYNVLTSPLATNADAGVFAFSDPCCQFGPTQGDVTNTYIDASSNIIYDPDPLTSQYGISWGFEAWGNGARYNNNLIQGYVCAGIVWGLGSNWSASYNTMQSSIMQNRTPCPFYPPLQGGFIGPEFPEAANAKIPPAQTGNVFGGAPTAVTSVAPTISPASGSQTFPLTVTLTDPGYTSGAVPLANTGIWYTTDGSTPVPGSGTAQYVATGGRFVLPAPATVKAVGMWGTPNQPTRYPAGYGFVPSAVKSAQYTSGVESQPRRPR